EPALLGEDGERRGAAALICGDDLLHLRAGPDLPRAGRAPLELRDQRDPRRDQRLLEGTLPAAVGELRLKLGKRDLLAAPPNRLAGRADKLLELGHRASEASLRERSMRSSSTSRARPPPIASRARSTPSRRSSAPPPTTLAAPP